VSTQVSRQCVQQVGMKASRGVLHGLRGEVSSSEDQMACWTPEWCKSLGSWACGDCGGESLRDLV
jgi:hypothetical protein